MRYAILVVFILSAVPVFSQEERLIFGDTEKTSMDPDYNSKGRYKGKKTLILIRKKARKVLDGNKCFKEYQQSIGVRVTNLSKGEPPYYNGTAKWINNMGTRIKGTFRLGPFWVIRLNKRMRLCRDNLHDFLG